MPTLFWQLLLCAVLVFNGLTIIIRKKKSGVSLTEQYNKEKMVHFDNDSSSYYFNSANNSSLVSFKR